MGLSIKCLIYPSLTNWWVSSRSWTKPFYPSLHPIFNSLGPRFPTLTQVLPFTFQNISFTFCKNLIYFHFWDQLSIKKGTYSSFIRFIHQMSDLPFTYKLVCLDKTILSITSLHISFTRPPLYYTFTGFTHHFSKNILHFLSKSNIFPLFETSYQSKQGHIHPFFGLSVKLPIYPTLSKQVSEL